MHVLECIHTDERFACVTLSVLEHPAPVCFPIKTHTHKTFYAQRWTGGSICPKWFLAVPTHYEKEIAKNCVFCSLSIRTSLHSEQSAWQNLIYWIGPPRSAYRPPQASVNLCHPRPCHHFTSVLSFSRLRLILTTADQQHAPRAEFQTCSNPAVCHPSTSLIKITYIHTRESFSSFQPYNPRR